jgi:type VI protein secretion system component Hcp
MRYGCAYIVCSALGTKHAPSKHVRKSLLENTMSDEIKKDEQVPEVKTEVSSEPLPESELDKVAGGKASVHDLSFTHNVDKASPVLLQ